MNEKRGPWYLLTGMVLGVILGLAYSVWLSPIEYARIAPRSLGSTYKDGYRILIAMAYDANGDIGRSQARLSLLNEDDSPQILAAQAQRLLSDGGRAEEASALVSLSDALLAHLASTATSIPTATTAIQEVTVTAPSATQPVVTPTLDPPVAVLTPTGSAATEATEEPEQVSSLIPKSTPLPAALTNAAFELDEKREVCERPAQNAQAGFPLLQVEVLDKNGMPLPGIPIQVRWAQGVETFFTGLYPQVSLGYADYRMDPAVVYSVQAGSQGSLETDLSAVECESEEGESFAGALWLTFTQP